uniref:Secreted protein n=1 Tax=Parascaris univalens TaxID=6257 RepID=A0A915BQT4_PARUN
MRKFFLLCSLIFEGICRIHLSLTVNHRKISFFKNFPVESYHKKWHWTNPVRSAFTDCRSSLDVVVSLSLEFDSSISLTYYDRSITAQCF